MTGDFFEHVEKLLGLTTNEKAIQRLNTGIIVPREVKLILRLGPRFCIPIPFNESLAQLLSHGIRRLNEHHLAVYEQRTISTMARQQIEGILGNRAKYATNM